MAKSQKIWKGEIEPTPHPSKKKSLSVWGMMRRTAIEPNHSNYLVFYICLHIVRQISCRLYVMSYNVIWNISELSCKILYIWKVATKNIYYERIKT